MQASTGEIGCLCSRCKSCPTACVLSSEWQLDMVRFLTNNHHFGVLTIDTTYNLGEFYVTPLVYPHLMLDDIETGKPPMLLGPVLVHQTVDFSAFHYFASTLIECRQDLHHLIWFRWRQSYCRSDDTQFPICYSASVLHPFP